MISNFLLLFCLIDCSPEFIWEIWKESRAGKALSDKLLTYTENVAYHQPDS